MTKSKKIKAPKRKLILHVGLPKTGSSALQTWCDQNRDVLLKNGIHYPLPSPNETIPKHQFVVNGFLKSDFTDLRAALKARRSQNTLLSSEGLSNHLDRFEKAALAEFRKITRNYDVHVFMVTRDPETWLRSLWKEGLLAVPGYVYGPEEYASRPRIQRLAQHDRLAANISKAFGAQQTTVARVEDGWKGALFSILGLDAGFEGLTEDIEEKNVSVSDDLCEIIRQVNARRLKPNLRGAILGLIQERFQTQHNRLIEALQFLPPGPKQVEKIKSVLGSLDIQNGGQKAIRDSLLEGCDDWF